MCINLFPFQHSSVVPAVTVGGAGVGFEGAALGVVAALRVAPDDTGVVCGLFSCSVGSGTLLR